MAAKLHGKSPSVKRATFAERLRQACDQSGFQLQHIAKELGIYPRTLSRWRSGESLPKSTRDWHRLAEVLGVSLEWLQGKEATTDATIPPPDQIQTVAVLLQRAGALIAEARSLCIAHDGEGDVLRTVPLAGYATYQRRRRSGDRTG